MILSISRTSLNVAVVLLVARALFSLASAQTSGGDALDAILARPVSPGTIAQLVNHAPSPLIVASLEAALKDSRPEVRAAAARVIFVAGLRGMTPAVTEALRGEADVSAAIEEARVLAHFTDADATIVDAWLRLGVATGAPVLHVLAAARGPSALSAFARVRSDAHEQMLPSLVRIATRGQRGAVLAVAGDALRQNDRALFAAVLMSARLWRSTDPALSDELAEAGLQQSTSQAVRLEAIWHTLAIWNPSRRLPKPLQAGFEQVRDGGIAPTDPASIIAIGLVARATGRQQGAIAGWSDALASSPAEIRHIYRLLSVRTLLTDEELETVGRATFEDAATLKRPTKDEIRSFDQASRPAKQATFFRTASGYPRGFVTDVYAAARCDPGDAQKVGPGAAMLTLRPDGRVMNVGLLPMPLPAGCAEAVKVLMMTYVADVDRVARGPQEFVLTLFDTAFIACQDANAALPAHIDAPGGRISQPKKIRHVAPKYPQPAIDDRVQGIVIVEATISPAGCVARADVTRGIDPRLDWAALQAVVGWLFTPTLLNGTPVPVQMTVTVAFTLT